MRRKPAVVLMVFFGTMMIVGGLQLGRLAQEYTAGKTAYEQLSQRVQAAPTAPASPQPLETEDTLPPGPEVDFEVLAEINPDVVGWITIEGTGIDYPIVQGEDNEVYLKRLFTGEANRAGCIFLDAGNSPDFSDGNSVVYGHQLRNGTMFSPLLNYKKRGYFEEHPTGWLLTPEKRYEVRFFSGFVCDVWDEVWELEPTKGWLSRMAGRSLFTGGPTPQKGDKILTLATCSYEFANARFVVLGVLEKQ